MGGIVGLGGGIGAARLWEALAVPARGGRGPLTLVLNTANDLRLHGLRICPDIDTVLYALSGRLEAGPGLGATGRVVPLPGGAGRPRRGGLVPPWRPGPGHASVPDRAAPRRGQPHRGDQEAGGVVRHHGPDPADER